MTNEEFATYLDSLPPEVRAVIHQAIKPIGDYAARAIEVRAWVAKEFPLSGRCAGNCAGSVPMR